MVISTFARMCFPKTAALTAPFQAQPCVIWARQSWVEVWLPPGASISLGNLKGMAVNSCSPSLKL